MRRGHWRRALRDASASAAGNTLTVVLHEHIERFGFAPNGKLFVGERNKTELPKGTINRTWREARRAVFTPDVYASPLAATPYDLRHACISFWIVAGVDPATAAKWAGQSIEILFRIYAAWLSGQDKALRKNIEDAYGNADE